MEKETNTTLVEGNKKYFSFFIPTKFLIGLALAYLPVKDLISSQLPIRGSQAKSTQDNKSNRDNNEIISKMDALLALRSDSDEEKTDIKDIKKTLEEVLKHLDRLDGRVDAINKR